MATRSAKIDQKADLIWAIADKLTGVYKPHEYGDVILPLTVIRRFDCILSDTKDAVLQKYDEVKNLPMKDILLRKASKKDFYNTSKYTFERLMDDPDHIEENFREYLNKFSANVRDILEKFKFDGHITTMANKGILYIVLKEYTTDRGNLHPNEISNLEMGYIFEEIIRRFSESHNEDAGQHYTPREVIQLMVNILFYDDNDILSGNNVAKTIYDPACGTGGMLSVANVDRTDIALAQRIIKFRALSTVNNYYLKYWMLNEGFQQFLHSLSTGSTATGIKSSKLFLLPLVRPNIEQQNKIVEYLDAKCSKIDEIVEKQKVIIEKLEEYKLSIITEAVTSGINPDVEMKDSGSVWFGNIPINWEMKRLKYVFHIQKDIAGEEGHTVLSITQRGISIG